jgi:sugar phosphate isomerase/epimerase
VRIIASSTLLFAYNVEEALRIAKELGYDGVEIWHFHLIKTGEDNNCTELRSLAEELDLTLSFHALSWDLNFASKLDYVREASLTTLEGSLDLAAELDANPVVIHPGRITIPGDSAEKYWKYLEEGVKRLTSYAQQINRTIGLEVMEHIPKEFFITPKDANRILTQVSSPNLGITFDAAHVPLEIEPRDYFSEMNKVIHIHLSDLTPLKRHIALNTGDRDFIDLVTLLINKNYSAVVIEGMEPERSDWLAKHNLDEMNRLVQKAMNNTNG